MLLVACISFFFKPSIAYISYIFTVESSFDIQRAPGRFAIGRLSSWKYISIENKLHGLYIYWDDGASTSIISKAGEYKDRVLYNIECVCVCPPIDELGGGGARRDPVYRRRSVFCHQWMALDVVVNGFYRRLFGPRPTGCDSRDKTKTTHTLSWLAIGNKARI